MSVRTALYAPAHRVMGRTPPGSLGGSPSINPSIDFGGNAIQDARLQYNVAGSKTGAAVIGWLNANLPKLTSQAPSTAAVNNIAAAANPANGVAMTLVSSTGAGITVVPTGGTFMMPNYTNVIPAGACAIDGLPGWTTTNSKFSSAFYDPTKGIARCVSVTGVGSGSGGAVTIKGADWYGYPMTQTITLGAGANTVNTTKAFKFVTSVTPAFTDTHAISVGAADVFGLNMAADNFADCRIYWNGVQQLLATFTAAVNTTPSATTGDVRGTFTPGSSSNGTIVLEVWVQPSVSRLLALPQTIWGATQF